MIVSYFFCALGCSAWVDMLQYILVASIDRDNLHIDRCEGSVSDCAAYGASKRESRVEGHPAELFRSLRCGLLNQCIELLRPRRAGGS